MPTKKKETFKITGNEPLMAFDAKASDNNTRSRRNIGATIERTDKYGNIEACPLPFTYAVGYTSRFIEARPTIELSKKAYFNVPIVRNIVELMTEFSVGELYLKGGNKASRNLINAWMQKINFHNLQDRYYRGYYREGNVFLYRFEGDIQPGDIAKITSTFGLTEVRGYSIVEVPPMRLPIRYAMIDPMEVMFAGSLSFYAGSYHKRLSDYELQRLRFPQTDEDKAVLYSLPKEAQKAILKDGYGTVTLPLEPDHVLCFFYKKQDYEPFGVSMIHPVLEDINAKLEMKRLDMAIARTQQQVILLVTTGTEPDKGGIDAANIKAFQKLFSNESIGRVLVADYTTNNSSDVSAIM